MKWRIVNLQYELFEENLFETEDGGRISKVYLERLAGTCGHIVSFYPIESAVYDYDRNFWKGDLHIHVLSEPDGSHLKGNVSWQNREVFSWAEEYEQEWARLELSEENMAERWDVDNWKEIRTFFLETYTPGIWERRVMDLYEESTKRSLTSD